MVCFFFVKIVSNITFGIASEIAAWNVVRDVPSIHSNSSVHIASFPTAKGGYIITTSPADSTTSQIFYFNELNELNWKTRIIFSSKESSLQLIQPSFNNSILVAGLVKGSMTIHPLQQTFYADSTSLFILQLDSNNQITFFNTISVESGKPINFFGLHSSSSFLYLLIQLQGTLNTVSTFLGSSEEPSSIQHFKAPFLHRTCALLQFSTTNSNLLKIKRLAQNCKNAFLQVVENDMVATAVETNQNTLSIRIFDHQLSEIKLLEEFPLPEKARVTFFKALDNYLFASTQSENKYTTIFQWNIKLSQQKVLELSSQNRVDFSLLDIGQWNKDFIFVVNETDSTSVLNYSTDDNRFYPLLTEKAVIAAHWTSQKKYLNLFSLNNGLVKIKRIMMEVKNKQEKKSFESTQQASKLGCPAGKYLSQRSQPVARLSSLITSSNTSQSIITGSSVTATTTALYTVGEFTNSVQLNNGNAITSRGEKDIYIINSFLSISTSDVIRWSLQIGGPLNDTVSKIRVFGNESSVLIIGNFASTCQFGNQLSLTTSSLSSMFMSRISSNGTILFAKTTSVSSVSSATALGESNQFYIVGGLFTGTLQFSSSSLSSTAGVENGYLAYFNANGDNLWLKQITATNGLIIKQIVIINDGFVVGGEYMGTIDLGNGNTFTSVTNQWEVFVVNYRLSDQSVIWTNRIPFNNNNRISLQDMSVDLDSNLFISGTFSTNANIMGITLSNALPTSVSYFAKLSVINNGNAVWANQVQNMGGNNAVNSVMRPDLLGNLFTATSFKSTSQLFDFSQFVYFHSNGTRISFNSTLQNVTISFSKAVGVQLYSPENVMSVFLEKTGIQSTVEMDGKPSDSSITTGYGQDTAIFKFVSHACANCERGTAKNFVSMANSCPVCPDGMYAPDTGLSQCIICDGFPINNRADCLSMATFVGIVIGAVFVVVASILFAVLTVALCIVQIMHERSSVSYQRTKARSQMLLYD